MILDPPCGRCHTNVSVLVEPEPLRRYLSGHMLVQDAFPTHTLDEREAIIGHKKGWFLCSTCWTDVFGEDDDD